MTVTKLLEGIKVVDLTSVVFGPYATKILVDLGADVIKIEPPTGDVFRYAGAPAASIGMGPCQMTLNQGKRSVALDLKCNNDAQILRNLLVSADVFVHNVRAKAIDRLGFGYDQVLNLHPDIVYVHCVGFGSDGPYSDLQAYDDVIQAASGAATLASRVDGDVRPRYIPSLIADKVAGLHGAYAILAAIIHKLRTGRGQFVEVPMFEAFAHFLLQEHLYGATFVPQTYQAGYPRQLDPNRQPFPTLDGYISIVPYTDKTLVELIGLLDADALLEDQRFATPGARARNMSLIYAEIALRTPARSSAEWSRLLADHQIPAMPVRDLDQILDDPHLIASKFFNQATHPTEGDYIEMRAPVRFSACPDLGNRHAPTIGQHSDEVRNSECNAIQSA